MNLDDQKPVNGDGHPALHAVYLPQVSDNVLAALFADWKSAFPEAGVLALVPEGEQTRIRQIQAAANQHSLPLTGALFPALLTEAGFHQSGITLLRFDTCPPCLLLEGLADQAPSASSDQIVEFATNQLSRQPSHGQPTLFLIFDGLLANIGTLLHALYQKLEHRVRYAGVNAGSESFQPTLCLFDNTRHVKSACIAFMIPATQHVVVEHAYPVSKALFRATSTDGNRIDQINGQPALAVYQALLKDEYRVELTPENFYQHAVHYPFGLITALDVLVRIPVGLTDDGAIHCVGEIPANSVLRLLHAPELAESQCVEQIAAQLPRTEQPLVIFYCAGRRMHFGTAASQELHKLVIASQSTALLGALSLGEIGTDKEVGMPVFHNAALLCLANKTS